ncbi:MAG: hypothetical protein AABZ39_06695 [Spirochaetota bacterium]
MSPVGPYTLTRRIALEHCVDGESIWLYSPSALSEDAAAAHAVLFGTERRRVIVGTVRQFLSQATPRIMYTTDVPSLRAAGFRGTAVRIILSRNDADEAELLSLRGRSGERLLVQEEVRGSIRIAVPRSDIFVKAKDAVCIGAMTCRLDGIRVPANTGDEAMVFMSRRTRNAVSIAVSPAVPDGDGICGDVYIDGESLSSLLVRYGWAYVPAMRAGDLD